MKQAPFEKYRTVYGKSTQQSQSTKLASMGKNSYRGHELYFRRVKNLR